MTLFGERTKLHIVAWDQQAGAKDSGLGPPVAQSNSWTVWTTGIAVPEASWVMQPMFPAAITSGAVVAIFASLRSRNLFASEG